MTGLILKDLLYLKQTAKILIVFLVFYPVLFAVTGSKSVASGTFAGLIVMLTLILSTNAFAYDEAAKWKTYEFSLPIRKSRAVLARYLFALLVSAVLTLLALLMEWLAFRGVLWETAIALLLALSNSLLFCAVLFPIMYKYGTQKARLFLLAVFLLPALGFMLISKKGLPMPGESSLMLGFRLFPILSAAAYVVSYGISCRICAAGTIEAGIGPKV